MFQVSAIPTFGGDAIAGMVLLDESNSVDGFSSHISFALALQAGEYDVAIKYGGIASQHMLGSPFELTVTAGLTNASMTTCEMITQHVTAGEELEARIFPKDRNGFGSNNVSDSFSVWVGGKENEKKEADRWFDSETQLSGFNCSKRVIESGLKRKCLKRQMKQDYSQFNPSYQHPLQTFTLLYTRRRFVAAPLDFLSSLINHLPTTVNIALQKDTHLIQVLQKRTTGHLPWRSSLSINSTIP